MNKLLIFSFVLVAACSSGEKKKQTDPETVDNKAFKKEKALSPSEVSDFYVGNTKSLNPALQDETLDRLSSQELSQVKIGNDALVELSVLCGRRDFKRAFKVASDNFDRYQKVPQYWTLVANCHLNQGSYRKALLFYNKALEVKPDYVPALNNIGVLYSRQGQDQKAVVAFERANKKSKFSKTPRYNLGKLYLTYGLATSAQPLFLGLLNDAPTDVDLLNAVASSYYLMSDYKEAMNYYRRIPQKEWQRAEIGLNVAVTLKKLGNAKDAHKVFESIEEPKRGTLKHYYASVEKQLGDAE